MVAAQSNTYLIVAKYNYEKWKTLVYGEYGEVFCAENAAERLFPETETPLFSEDKPPKPFRPGVRFVDTFESDIFPRLEEIRLGQIHQGAQEKDLTPQEKIEILDPLVAEHPPTPPVGWLAILDHSEMGRFFEDMSSFGGHLWEMYDIEISPIDDNWSKEDLVREYGPLNNDTTTNKVYLNMSIRNWS
jgi:hypothetical protein